MRRLRVAGARLVTIVVAVGFLVGAGLSEVPALDAGTVAQSPGVPVGAARCEEDQECVNVCRPAPYRFAGVCDLFTPLPYGARFSVVVSPTMDGPCAGIAGYSVDVAAMRGGAMVGHGSVVMCLPRAADVLAPERMASLYVDVARSVDELDQREGRYRE